MTPLFAGRRRNLAAFPPQAMAGSSLIEPDERLMQPTTPRPASYPASNDVLAKMIQAEENEGGPPSPEPCDMPPRLPTHHRPPKRDAETEPPMQACPAPEHVIHLPLGPGGCGARSGMLLKAAGLELVRLVVPADKEIPPHRVPVEITVQCLEGRVAFAHDGRTALLAPGDLIYLCPNELHSLKGIEDATVLVTRIRQHATDLPEKAY